MKIDVFEYSVTVTPADMDENAHANNVSYVQWMQEAAVAHSVANGWDYDRYLAIGAVWVARRHTVEYLQPALEAEKLVVRTWVADMKSVRSTRKYQFIRLSDGQTVATAETLWVFVSTSTRRPIKLPPEVVDCFVLLPEVLAPSVSAGSGR